MNALRAAALSALIVLSPVGCAMAQSLGLGPDVASVTYGPYARAEMGHARNDAGGGFWDPPGGDDPRIFFDLDAEDGSFGALAIGFDWQNGWRADMSLSRLGRVGVAGPCSGASDASPCDLSPTIDNHADIESASVSSTAMMANVFFAPLEARGSNTRFQPFIVAGLGLSRNKVGAWTRENNGPETDRPSRTFAGNSSSEFAWSLGLGASWQITPPGRRPIIVEASWRYYDLGKASGGTTPLSDDGRPPRTPLTFDNRSSVVSVAVRIPLVRY